MYLASATTQVLGLIDLSLAVGLLIAGIGLAGHPPVAGLRLTRAARRPLRAERPHKHRPLIAGVQGAGGGGQAVPVEDRRPALAGGQHAA
jgi:hypothetical protein